MPRRVEVRVQGRDLVVERPWGSSPRLLADGAELPRDRFGRAVLVGDDGAERVVATAFDWRRLTPVLRIGDERVPVEPPLPRGAWWLLAPVLVLSLFGGGIGAGLGIGAAWAAADRLRRAPSAAVGWTQALAAVLVAVALYLGSAALIGALL